MIGTITWVTEAPISDPIDKLILMYACTGPSECDNPRAVWMDPGQQAEGLGLTKAQMLWHIENLQSRGWLSRFYEEPTAISGGGWWVMLTDPRSREEVVA